MSAPSSALPPAASDAPKSYSAPSGGRPPQSGVSSAVSPTTGSPSALVTEKGRTAIADQVVEKIAGLSAREVGGVYRLGSASGRALSAVRERIPGGRPSVGSGVVVEVGERQTAVDLTLVVEYGVEIGELSRAVRRNVINAIERMTALEVTEVNIYVDDVHLPDENDDANGESRVQ